MNPDRVKPLENPATAQWGRPITHSDYTKMLKGFFPPDMDGKWAVATKMPDAQGNTVVSVCRSWTSTAQYVLTIEAGDFEDTKAKAWGKIVKIDWNILFGVSVAEQEDGVQISEKKAKKNGVGACKWLLGCEMEGEDEDEEEGEEDD
jgi:hypothetical protein